MTTSAHYSLRQRIHRSLRPLALLCCLLSLTVTPQAFALSLDAAKQQGLVGEQTNGYLGSVKANPSSDVKKLIADINNKRRAVYIDKAKAAGVSLPIMEQRVGQRLIQRATSGEYVSDGAGHWQKK